MEQIVIFKIIEYLFDAKFIKEDPETAMSLIYLINRIEGTYVGDYMWEFENGIPYSPTVNHIINNTDWEELQEILKEYTITEYHKTHIQKFKLFLNELKYDIKLYASIILLFELKENNKNWDSKFYRMKRGDRKAFWHYCKRVLNDYTENRYKEDQILETIKEYTKEKLDKKAKEEDNNAKYTL